MPAEDEFVVKCLKCGYAETRSTRVRYCPNDGSLLTRTRARRANESGQSKAPTRSVIDSAWLSRYLKLAKQDKEYYPEYLEILRQTQGKSCLTRHEFLEIVGWKLKKAAARFKRIADLIEQNTEERIRQVTSMAFAATTEKAMIEILKHLNGVGIPVASAILTCHDPIRYAIFDMHAWRSLYDLGLVDTKQFKRDYPSTPSYGYYEAFIRVVRNLGATHGLTPREVELALFAYDREQK